MYLWGSELPVLCRLGWGTCPTWGAELSENQLTGAIPSSLGNLSELTSLSV